MKKVLCISLVLSFAAGIVLVTGCGGGGSGGILAAIGIVTLIITASAGAPISPVAFAASTRRPAIRANVSVSTAGLSAYIVPRNGATDGTPILITNIGSDTIDASGAIVLRYQLSKAASDNQYRIEIRNASGNPILKSYLVQAQSSTNIDAPVSLTATSTAKALVYEKWLTDALNSGKVYDQFEAVATESSYAKVSNEIVVEMNKPAYAGPSYNLAADPEVTTEVNTAAEAVEPDPIVGRWNLVGTSTVGLPATFSYELLCEASGTYTFLVDFQQATGTFSIDSTTYQFTGHTDTIVFDNTEAYPYLARGKAFQMALSKEDDNTYVGTLQVAALGEEGYMTATVRVTRLRQPFAAARR